MAWILSCLRTLGTGKDVDTGYSQVLRIFLNIRREGMDLTSSNKMFQRMGSEAEKILLDATS